MRLGQLARKLEIRPAEIVEFLATKGMRLEESANAKLEDEHVKQALQHFAPNTLFEEVQEDEGRTIDEPMGEVVDGERFQEESKEVLSEPSSNEIELEKTEVIKAPKIELSGLKVLGKIDLPETKKKQSEPSQENIEQQPSNESSKEKRTPKFKRQQRSDSNPIALQREQEALAAKKKREEEIRLQKERRTQNYLKKVKAHQPTKAAKWIKEQTEEMTPTELAEPPKSWWGKFLKWLTS